MRREGLFEEDNLETVEEGQREACGEEETAPLTTSVSSSQARDVAVGLVGVKETPVVTTATSF